MSTDKIQTKLFERADSALKVAVEGAVLPLSRYAAGAGARGLRLKFNYDVKITKVDGFEIDQALKHALDAATISIPMSAVMAALRTALFESQQSANRTAEVEEFLAKIDRLSEDVADLQSRVE